MNTEDLASVLFGKLLKDGGFTARVRSVGVDKFAVSFPDVGFAVSVETVAEELYSYFEPIDVEGALRRLADNWSDFFIGGWYDEDSDTLEISRSDVLSSLGGAQTIASAHNERFIFDLAKGEEVPVTNCGLSVHPVS